MVSQYQLGKAENLVITVCVPTRGRPDRFKTMLESLRATAADLERIEVVAVYDKDDATRLKYPRKGVTAVSVDRPENMSELWDVAAKKGTGQLIMLCADDFVFETPGWDARVREAFAEVQDGILMVYTATGVDDRPIAPFVTRQWVNAVGFFTPHDYQGWFADEWIWALACELERVRFLPDVMIRHHQFEEIDETYATANQKRFFQGGLEGMRKRFYSVGEVKRRDEHIADLKRLTDGTVVVPEGQLPVWWQMTKQWNAASRVKARNPGLLVTVHCYQGDADRVKAWLPQYLHHGRPVLVMSPEDSPVKIDHPQVMNYSGGPRAYIGQKSMDRQRNHMEHLLTLPFDWFLMNDADSVCLAPDLPEFLFERDDVLWSLHAQDWRTHDSPYPKIGLHPPYFAHRKVIAKLLSAADKPEVEAHPVTPFIDWYMLALAEESGTEYKPFPAELGWTFPAWRYKQGSLPDNILLPDDHEEVMQYQVDGDVPGDDLMAARVHSGAVFLHSIKHPEVMERLVAIARDRRVALGDEQLVSILVPFTAEKGDEWRTRTWNWVEARWRATVPNAEIVVGVDPGTPPGPYSKTAAVNDAYHKARGDVFVIADADAWLEPDALYRAVDVARKTNKLVVPWKFVLRLDEANTQAVLKMDPTTPFEVTAEMRDTAFNGPDPMSAGTVLVISRAGFEAVEGMDPRFRGWGMEDVAFGRACNALLGPTVYGYEEVISLYHPRPSENVRGRVWEGETDVDKLDNHPNIWLAKLYDAAANDANAMRQVVAAHPLRETQVPLEDSIGALRQAVAEDNVVYVNSPELFSPIALAPDETFSEPIDGAPGETWTIAVEV